MVGRLATLLLRVLLGLTAVNAALDKIANRAISTPALGGLYLSNPAARVSVACRSGGGGKQWRSPGSSLSEPPLWQRSLASECWCWLAS